MPVLLHHNTTSRSSFPNNSYNNATPTILPETTTTSSIRNIIMMHETMTTTTTTTTLLEETKDALVFLYHYGSKCQSGEDEECSTIIPMEFHRSKKAIHLVVQEGVQVLPDNACKDVRPLVSVVLPASLQTMGHGVFSQCENLQHVTFSSTMASSQSQLEVIGDDAFGDCNALTTLELPSSVKSIGKRAFYQSGLTCMVLPPNIKIIPDHAFHGCKHLTNVTLPTHVTRIGKKAFSSCLHLQDLHYHGQHLTHLDFQGYRLGVDGLQTIRKFLSSCTSNIQSLSLRNVMISRQPANRTGKLHQDDLSVVLDMVSKCPTLTKLDLSYNDFTHDVLPWLATSSQIPSHLRHLLLYRIMQDDHSYDPQVCLTYIMNILKQHSNLVLWTEPIIMQQNDNSKMMMMNHCLDWNQYIGGNKDWMILPDAIWPLLLERLYQLDLPPPLPLQHQHQQQQRSRTTSLRTSSTNLVYHLLRQNPQVLFASSSSSSS